MSVPPAALKAAGEGVGERIAEVGVERADAEGNGDAPDVERQRGITCLGGDRIGVQGPGPGDVVVEVISRSSGQGRWTLARTGLWAGGRASQPLTLDEWTHKGEELGTTRSGS